MPTIRNLVPRGNRDQSEAALRTLPPASTAPVALRRQPPSPLQYAVVRTFSILRVCEEVEVAPVWVAQLLSNPPEAITVVNHTSFDICMTSGEYRLMQRQARDNFRGRFAPNAVRH
ncbi:MAG: hypothetical protein ABI871_05955 [Chthoniobacterales bacterium]